MNLKWWLEAERILQISSLLLGAVGLLLAAAGVIAFINLRHTARAAAKDEAGKIAANVAESTAIAHIMRELPVIIREYRELSEDSIDDEEAEETAEAQENGGR